MYLLAGKQLLTGVLEKSCSEKFREDLFKSKVTGLGKSVFIAGVSLKVLRNFSEQLFLIEHLRENSSVNIQKQSSGGVL